MALGLNISVNTVTSGGFTFSEITGIYNATTNPGGWGGVNPVTNQATEAWLDIYKPDPNTFLPVNTPAAPINLLNQGYPINTTTNSFFVSPQNAGFLAGETTADGVYQFVYRVTVAIGGNDFDYVASQYVLVYSGAQCCVSKLAVQAINDGGGCGCGSGCGESMSEFEKGMLLIEAAKYSITCGLIVPAANAIKHVNEICGGCSTC